MIPERNYLQLLITVTRKQGGSYVVKATSDAGEAETETKLPFQRSELEQKLERFSLIASGKEAAEEGELQRFGQSLYQMLFTGATETHFQKMRKIANYPFSGVRIDLDIQDLGLRRLPWEMMHDGNGFLALSRETPVTRLIASGKSAEPKPIMYPMRILFAAAKPWGTTPLNMGRQIRSLCNSLKNAIQEGAIVFHPALGEEVHPDNLRMAIRNGEYHVLHISTHGALSQELEKGIVLLQDGAGNSIPVVISALGDMLRDTTVQLIYLDACETGRTPLERESSLSEILSRSGKKAAIAMQFSIPDTSATRFSEAFYASLTRGEPLWCAVTEARVTIRDLLGRETLDWAIPTLYVRDSYTLVTSGAKQKPLRYGEVQGPLRFFGRDVELDQLAEMLLHPSSRVVAVHGFGGIGKSAIVQKISSEMAMLFADACFVDCRDMKSIIEIVQKVNTMLSSHGYPVIEDQFRLLNELGKVDYFATQLDKERFLIALDNIDDMQDQDSTKRFLDHASRFVRARVLVTCRIPDDSLPYQRKLRLQALEPRYAIILMREVGQDIPQIANATQSDLSRINEKLRGHPQSIMFAIRCFESGPFEKVLQDLSLRVKSEDKRAEEILQWSYGKLSPEEQRFLENSSVFWGAVPMEGLLEVNDGKSREILDRLVRKNMIVFDQVQLFSLHPLLREYVYEKLGERKDEIQIKAATEIAPRCEAAFWSEALRLYELGVESAKRTKNEKILFNLLIGLGNMYLRVGEYDKARKTIDTSQEVNRKLGDQAGAATTLHQLGIIEQQKGNYDAAAKLYTESLEIKRKLGNQSGIASSLHQLGMIEQQKGNYDAAAKLYTESLEIKRKLGNQSGIANTFGQLGRLAEAQKDFNSAERHYRDALEIFERLGAKQYIKLAKKDLERVQRLKRKT